MARCLPDPQVHPFFFRVTVRRQLCLFRRRIRIFYQFLIFVVRLLGEGGFVRTRPGATHHEAGCDRGRVRENPTSSDEVAGFRHPRRGHPPVVRKLTTGGFRGNIDGTSVMKKTPISLSHRGVPKRRGRPRGCISPRMEHPSGCDGAGGRAPESVRPVTRQITGL